MWGRWSSGKTQESGSRGPGFESRPDHRIFLSKKFVPRCSSPPRCINGYPDRAVFVQARTKLLGARLIFPGHDISLDMYAA